MSYGRWRQTFRAFRQRPQMYYLNMAASVTGCLVVITAPTNIIMYIRREYFNEDVDQWRRDRKYHATYQHTNPDKTAAKFEYQPLRETGTSVDIRLVELQPGEGNEKIKLKIRNYELRNKLRYFALSYVWGNDKPTNEINLNKSPFLVQDNLYSALLHIRDPKEVKTLWIDAICINQDDHLERTSHVKRMYDLYELAEGVIVWLGTNESKVDATRVAELMFGLNRLHKMQLLYLGFRRQIELKSLGLTEVEYMLRLCKNPDVYRIGEPLSYRVAIETSQEYTKKSTVIDLNFEKKNSTKWKAEEAIRKSRHEPPDTVMQTFYAGTESAWRTVLGEKDIEAWEFLRSMIENRYFTRSWIIQEIVLGKNPIIQIGHKTFDAKTFLGAAMALKENPWLVKEVSPEVVFKEDAVYRLWKLSFIAAAHQAGGFRLPLSTLLYDLKGKQAHEDRDQIYSLIGIATYKTLDKPKDYWGRSARSRLVNPSRAMTYSNVVEKWYYAIFHGFKDSMPPPIIMDTQRATILVYRDAAGFILQDEQSLALLSQVNSASQKLQSEAEWPSWVPDWTMLGEPIPQDVPAFRMLVPEEHQGFTRDGNSLNVKGHHVDTIVRTFSLPKVTEENPAASSISKLLNEHRGNEEIVWRLLIRDPEGKAIPKKVLAAATSTLIQHGKKASWLPIPLAKVKPAIERSPEYMKLIGKASSTWSEQGRSVCVTVGGKFLLGPAEAQPGDRVCVVGGASSPLILRENGDTYSLVGDSYVHGLVDEITADSMVWDMKKLVIV